MPNPQPAGLTELEQVFRNVISVVAALGFITLLVMLITAGFKYLTSGGEPKAVQASHITITWALLGIVFMALAWIILQLISSFTGVEVVKTFDIRTLCGGPTFPFCSPPPVPGGS